MTTEQRTASREDRIEPDRWRPGPEFFRLAESGIPVWALISYLPAVDGLPERVAEDYNIPVDDMLAALAFYDKHRARIDAQILLTTVSE